MRQQGLCLGVNYFARKALATDSIVHTLQGMIHNAVKVQPPACVGRLIFKQRDIIPPT